MLVVDFPKTSATVLPVDDLKILGLQMYESISCRQTDNKL